MDGKDVSSLSSSATGSIVERFEFDAFAFFARFSASARGCSSGSGRGWGREDGRRSAGTGGTATRGFALYRAREGSCRSSGLPAPALPAPGGSLSESVRPSSPALPPSRASCARRSRLSPRPPSLSGLSARPRALECGSAKLSGRYAVVRSSSMAGAPPLLASRGDSDKPQVGWAASKASKASRRGVG
jgi:hypothetical protein